MEFFEFDVRRYVSIDPQKLQWIEAEDEQRAVQEFFEENRTWLYELNNVLLTLAYRGESQKLHGLARVVIGMIKTANQGCRLTLERMADNQ